MVKSTNVKSFYPTSSAEETKQTIKQTSISRLRNWYR